MNDIAVTLRVVTAFLFLLIPVINELGVRDSKWSGSQHRLASTLTVLVACFAPLAQFYHFRALKPAIPKLLTRLYWTTLLILLSVAAGNWLYVAYRAPDGAMQWFLMHSPNDHLILM